jgi:DNA-binding SARP family transcriptional activator
MNILDVRLFGGVQVFLNGKRVGPFPTRWASGLLAYLALNQGKTLHRDVLTALFWPEEPDRRARKSLRNALWRVRSLIEPPEVPAGSFLTVAGQSVGLAGEPSVFLDVAEFDRIMASVGDPVPGEDGVAGLEECVRLFRGDFMEGHDYPWCVYERERLRLGLLTALEHLLSFHLSRQEWSLALQRGRAVLQHDPFREHVHRCLMMCHYFMGDRPLAIRQYRECVQLLDEEMGLDPMEETRRLYREIQGDSLPLNDPKGHPRSLAANGAGPQLTEAFARAEEALANLRRLAVGPPPVE